MSPSSEIRYVDRVLVTGATGTGKSELAKRLFLSVPAPRLVIDPNDSETTEVPGAVTFRDPARLPREAATMRFVPADPADRDAYDRLYREVFLRRFPMYLWLDEPDQAAPANGWPRYVNTTVTQGRKRSIGHLTCATRPKHIMVSLVAQAAHVMVFDLPNAADRRTLAENTGVPLDVLEREMAALPEFGFLWWAQRARRLTVCPPLRLR